MTQTTSQSRRRPTLLWGVAISIAAWLTACSLAGDVTPPPGYEQVSATQAQAAAASTGAAALPSDVGFPSAMPSAVEGARLYAENCTRCHGVAGGGDGEMASQIQFPIPAFNIPDLARQTTPARWFSVITNGNLDRLMPPWKDSLSDSERWSLVAYLYTLSAPKAQLETGEKIFTANCASCHGDDGKGKEGAPSFADQQFMAATSNEDFFAALTTAPHEFESWPETDRWAVVDTVRAFSFEYAALSASGAVTGRLTNGTLGAAVPADLPVTLRTFDNFQEAATLTATAKSDGMFTFADVDLPPGRAFLVSARYGDVVYTSDVSQVVPGQTTYDLPLQIFETTTDPAAIRIERLSIAMNFQAEVGQVAEHFIISNTSDKTFVAASGGPTFSAALPSGYTSLGFQDGRLGERYQQTADGFADTEPIRPGAGSHRILLSFALPYRNALQFAQTLSYPAAAVNVLLPANGVTVSGPGLADLGVRDIEGRQFQTYAVSNLQAGQPVSFEVSGNPSPASGPAINLGNNRDTIVGVLALALVVAGLAYVWVRRAPAKKDSASLNGEPRHPDPKGPMARPASTSRVDQLLDELADLDLAFEAGQQPEAEYRAKRAKLKMQLKALLEKRQTSNVKRSDA